jgi:hypothetical protein
MKKSLAGIIRFLMLMVVLHFSSAVFAADTTDDGPAQDDKDTIRLYEGVDLTSVTEFAYAKRTVIKSVFPQLRSEDTQEGIDGFNQTVRDLIKQNADDFKKKVIETQNAKPSSFTSDEPPPTNLKNDMTVDFNTSYIKAGSNHIVSVRFSMQGYLAGMVHPYHQHDVVNYDIDNNAELSLSDLFTPNSNYLDIISQYTRDELKKHLTIKDMIDEGTAPKADNFSVWNLKSNGILITFEEYQVAPYVYGAQTVLVPYSVLKDVIPTSSPIAPCLKNKRGCSANHQLTGGFIDEARITKHSRKMAV